MFEIGDTLREARIRRGLSLKDVEDALKVRSKYLQALEQDDFEVIPGTTFVKAFLRTYATFLGLDAEQLVDEYVSRYEPAHPEVVRANRPTRSSAGSGGRRPPPLASSRTRADRRRQPNFLLVGVVAVIIIVILALVFRDSGEEPAVIEPGPTDTTTTLEDVGSDLTEPSDEPSATGDPADVAAPLSLVIRAAMGPSWLLVRSLSDDKVLYSDTLPEGEELSFEEPGGFRLSVGAPMAVLLVVDGVEVAVPEPYGDFTLTVAGLERVQ